MQFKKSTTAVLSLVSFFETTKSRSSYKTIRNIDCGQTVTNSKSLVKVQAIFKSLLERQIPLQMCTACFCGRLDQIVTIQQWVRKQLKAVRAKKALQKQVLVLQSLARGKSAREEIIKQKKQALEKKALAIQSLVRGIFAREELINEENKKTVTETAKPAPKKVKKTKKAKKSQSTVRRTHHCSNPNCYRHKTTGFTKALFKGEYLWEDKKSVIKIKPSTKKLTVAKAPRFYTAKRSSFRKTIAA